MRANFCAWWTTLLAGCMLLLADGAWRGAECQEPKSEIPLARRGGNPKSEVEKPPPRKLSDAELQALLDRLEKELGKVKSLKADLVQEKRLSLFTDVVTAQGVCLFRKPDAVRFEITEPFRSVVVARQEAVAKYEFLEGAWQKLKLGNPDVVLMVTRQIASWLQGRFREKADLYEISATVSDHTTILLTPRHERFRQFLTGIELALTEGEKRIASVTLREPGGDFTRLTFSNEALDPDIPDEVFDTSRETPAEVKLPEKEKEAKPTA